uniref:B30.2/SPRY domain-containing protein n=1 Tax=Salmo trutta TaxID=8032 RepID=A0A674CG32_SALTR
MSLSGESEEGSPVSKMSLSGERGEGGPDSKMSLSGEREEGGPDSKMSLSEEREEGGPDSKMSLSGESEEGGPDSKMSLSGEREEGSPDSKMSLSGEREEGGPDSKMSLSGEREEGGPDSKRSLSGEREEGGPDSKMSLSEEREEGGPASKMSLSGEREEGGPTSKMSLSGEREEGGPASKMHLSGGHDTKAKRNQQERSESEILSGQSSQSHQTDLDSIFSLLEEKMMTFVKNELKMFKRILSPELPEGFESQKQDKEVVDVEDEKQESSAREGALKITLHVLRKMNQKELADTLENYSDELAVICQRELKSNLKKKFQCVFEGIAKQGNPTLLNKIYTELYITEGGTGQVNNEHELRQIETTTRKQARPETAIKCNDIFKPLTGQDKRIRTVLTKGVAGIGKTVSVQKFILDWAEGKANQDVQFVFSFPFRELNLMKEEKHTFIELLNHFSMETKESRISNYDKYKVLFIFDGLDECRLPLDFQKNKICCDVTESTSVDVLLTNLIKGNLLPSALLWITTRPAAANKIPSGCVDQVTEVRGFNDPQKEEYFRKRFSDEDLASRIISHIKTSRSLHIMCHIPVFCWISAIVLENMLKHKREEMPKTLTDMYTHLVVFHTKQKNEKYLGKEETGPHWNKKSILSLGKLAFQQLVKGNLIFYEEDLKEAGIDVSEASVYSGLCTQLFKEECGLYQDKVYCFVHLSIQEFLAAVYVFLSFINNNENLMDKLQTKSSIFSLLYRDKAEVTVYKSAVDKALQSEMGNLDLFVRFLLGLSLESNQKHLRGLLTKTRSSSQTHEETVKYIKEKIRENPSPERSINLFHCLNELNDHSLVEEIQSYLSSGSLSKPSLSPAHWSALVFVLLTSEKELDVFDLKKYSRSEEGLLRLLPVVKASRAVLLSGCGVTEEGCASLVSALESNPSHLRELDLSNNDLKDSGVKLLSAGLGNPHCKLETLRLSGCLVTEEGCASLVSALRSNPSHLRELDLSYNHPGDSGVRLLSAGLEDPHCRLEKLNVEHGGENRMKPGLRKYVCDLTLDLNTVNRHLSLSEENRKVTWRREEQPYPDHPERFEDREQVLCREGLTGRCYWEVEWSGSGGAVIGVTYKGISRRGGGNDCGIGYTDKSWSLFCYDNRYSACHNNNPTTIDVHPSSSHRVGVYLDWPAGTLSFYRASSDTLTHLITFTSTFTEPLYPAFRVHYVDSSVSLK